MSDRVVFVGLDGEMSGNETTRECAGKLPHRLIQIGVAFGPEESWSSLIAWPDGAFDWSAEAAEVHKIPRAEVTLYTPYAPPSKPTPGGVDVVLYQWLTDAFARRGVTGRSGVMVGFNVGAFDTPFVARDLPLTMTLFTRRSVDLNALCFALDDANRKYVERIGTRKGQRERRVWKTWKRHAKAYAAQVIGGEDRSHDAGYDAMQAIVAFEWLTDRMADIAKLEVQ